MSDRELLELAAKAAGLEVSLVNDFFYFGTGTGHATYWNPLMDDGDALRLAVKLGLTVNPMGEPGISTSFAHNVKIVLHPSELDDEYAATRRAIVRAAAEIGKAMEG